MSSTPAPDVIVIGAGLVGAATALGLAESGFTVTVLEADFPGGGSTGAAMGHIVAMDDSDAQLSLCAYSRARWHAILESLPDDCEDDRCGTLWIAADEAEFDAARQKVRTYHDRGLRAELLDATALRAAEPNLAPGFAGALRVPEDSVCYPPAVARELVRRAAELGATIRLGDRVASIAPKEVRLSNGTRLTANAIVVAAGVSSAALVPDLPVVPRKGHLVITDRRPGTVHHQLVELGYLRSAHTFGGASIAFNVQPRHTGQLLIGSSRELVGFDSSINRALLAAMLERATRFVPVLNAARSLRTWTGFRPATPDKLPLIGPWPAIEGVWIATGHEGLGITMATGTADLIVAGIRGVAPPIDPAPFRPDREMPAMLTEAA